jgi:hypothetical protein
LVLANQGLISAGRIDQPIMCNVIDFKAKRISRYTRVYDADLGPLVADRGILFRVITLFLIPSPEEFEGANR